jgi:hypothetical protein
MILVFALIFNLCTAQSNTEVYLFDLDFSQQNFKLTNPTNISNNEGYDNQPSFLLNENSVLFSSNRNGQTDVVKYNIESKSSLTLTNSNGSEYSPLQTPDLDYFSCIILEQNGQQLLWKYPFGKDNPEKVNPELKVGYNVWRNVNELYVFVLEEDGNNLYKIKNNEVIPMFKNIGRSLNFSTDRDELAFIKNDSTGNKITLYNPNNDKARFLINTIEGSDDFCWLDKNTLLMGSGSKLYTFDIKKNKSWNEVFDLSVFNLSGVTRMAISPDKSNIAVVVSSD